MQYMLMIYDDGAAMQNATKSQTDRSWPPMRPTRTAWSRPASFGRGAPAPAPHSNDGARAGRQGASRQRALCGVEGAVRRFLHNRRRRPRRSNQMGRALPERPAWRGRGAADLAAMSRGERNSAFAASVERVARESYGRLLAHLAAAGATSPRQRTLWPRRSKPLSNSGPSAARRRTQPRGWRRPRGETSSIRRAGDASRCDPRNM